ncbi:MAG: VIT domain-containing protein [Acidobacteriota bacterium]|nr:VIT domain-containing protein [Acidobacteriota bacterium]
MQNAQFQSTRRLLLATLAVLSFAAFAAAQEDDDRSLSPYFFVTGDPAVDHLPLKDTNVDIAVAGVIADVKVTQKYRNEGTRPINANYIFPASTRAAVYSMRMRIGDEVIIAKIKEREAAKQEFETAKKQGKSASLLEQKRPNVFSMKMANLMPKEEIEIELRYTELLIPTKGVYELVYPTVVGPRYSSEKSSNDKRSDNGFRTAHLREGKKPTSTLHISTRISAGVPIQNLECTSHEIVPERDGATVASLTLDDKDPFTGNRDFIVRYSLAGNQVESGLLLYEGPDENFFLYLAQPPGRVETFEIPAREYVFVVDVSGSMEGFPLDTSKQLLEDLIGGMRPTDFFNVILFAGDSVALSESPIQANKANIARAIQLIEEQRGLGGTELLAAIQQAMNLPQKKGVSRNIVLVTDGYISGEDGVFQYIRENLNRSNVFSFGIGSSVNRYLINGVAKAGMGEPFIVTEESEARRIASSFREYIRSPVLTDITIKPNGFETYDVYPIHQPDLLAERPLVVFGKWRGPVTGTFELRGKTGRGDYAADLDISGVQPIDSNRALRYLWARSRIAELSDYGYGDITDQKIKEVTSLGLKYNLLTRYTSFVAVREKIINPGASANEVNQPLPLPVGVSDMAVGSEPELIWLIAVAVLIAFSLIALRGGRLILATAAGRHPAGG